MNAPQPSPIRKFFRSGIAQGRIARYTRLAIHMALVLVAFLMVGVIYSYLTRITRQEAIEWIEAKGGTVSPILTEEKWTILGYMLPYEWKSEKVVVEVLDLPLTEDEQEDLGFYLRSLGAIDMLYLSGSQVDDRWMERMGEQDNIRSLQLNETSISTEQLQSLLEWGDLRQFFNLKNPHLSKKDWEKLQTELNRRGAAFN